MMPTSERRFYLGMLLESKQKENESYEQAKKNSGKGGRTKTISGDALKTGLQTGEIKV